MASEELVNVDLIPVSEYPESMNSDNVKVFKCNRCGRVFTTKHGPSGVKQHILQVHIANGEMPLFQADIPKSKSKKRKAKGGEDKSSKKPNVETSVASTPIEPKSPDENLESFVKSHESTSDRNTFNINDTISEDEEIDRVDDEQCDEDEDDFLPLGQGTPVNNVPVNNSESEIDTIDKAETFVLEMEIKGLKNTLKARDLDLRTKDDQIAELESKNMALMKKEKEMEEKLVLLETKEASFDETKKHSKTE